MTKQLVSDEDEYAKHARLTQQILDEKFAQGRIKKMSMDEVLEGINEIQDFDTRVQVLRNNSERSLNTLLLFTFDGVPWALSPEDVKTVKYRAPDVSEDQHVQGTDLYAEGKRLYVFRLDTLTRKKGLELLIEMLENIHPNEGEILKGMLLGKLPYTNITKDLVATAFPDLFPGYVPVRPEEKKEEGTEGKSEPQENESSEPAKEPVPSIPSGVDSSKNVKVSRGRKKKEVPDAAV